MNKTEIDTRLHELDRTMLTGMARRALNSQTIELADWEVQTINQGMGSATGGVYRVAGVAHDDLRLIPWSIILKVLVRPSSGPTSTYLDDEVLPLYWKREALAYQSGLLNDLPGELVAARCLDIVEFSSGAIGLWLEDVIDQEPQWSLAHFEHAAHCLGRFNGAYFKERPMPSYTWLTRDGSPRGVLDHFTALQEVIRNSATWQHPLVRAAYPIPVAERLLQLWAHRGTLLDALERLPYTFCHLDAWRKNMFESHGVGGPTTVIDWAYVGRGVIASDAGDLMGASFGTCGAPPCSPAVFDMAIFENYLRGLYDAGWQGDQSAARFAFTAFTSLKYGGLLLELADIFHVERYARWENVSGHPMAEFLDNKAALTYYLLDLADEARHLML